jgi:hypothetical protein
VSIKKKTIEEKIRFAFELDKPSKPKQKSPVGRPAKWLRLLAGLKPKDKHGDPFISGSDIREFLGESSPNAPNAISRALRHKEDNGLIRSTGKGPTKRWRREDLIHLGKLMGSS